VVGKKGGIVPCYPLGAYLDGISTGFLDYASYLEAIFEGKTLTRFNADECSGFYTIDKGRDRGNPVPDVF
jgi:hypothetical protein